MLVVVVPLFVVVHSNVAVVSDCPVACRHYMVVSAMQTDDIVLLLHMEIVPYISDNSQIVAGMVHHTLIVAGLVHHTYNVCGMHQTKSVAEMMHHIHR